MKWAAPPLQPSLQPSHVYCHRSPVFSLCRFCYMCEITHIFKHIMYTRIILNFLGFICCYCSFHLRHIHHSYVANPTHLLFQARSRNAKNILQTPFNPALNPISSAVKHRWFGFMCWGRNSKAHSIQTEIFVIMLSIIRISFSFWHYLSLFFWQMCTVLRLHKQLYMSHQVKIYSFHYLTPLVS